VHKTTAYHRRASLDAHQLEQLLVALRDDGARYRQAISGYTPEKMRQHGQPHLSELEEQVSEIERLLLAKQSAE
jgi:hypothetical protein